MSNSLIFFFGAYLGEGELMDNELLQIELLVLHPAKFEPKLLLYILVTYSYHLFYASLKIARNGGRN